MKQSKKGQSTKPQRTSTVNKDQAAFTRPNRARYFITKVDVSWCVDKIDQILVTVRMMVYDRDCLRFDRDSSLPLHLELVEELCIGGSRYRPSHLDVRIVREASSRPE